MFNRNLFFYVLWWFILQYSYKKHSKTLWSSGDGAAFDCAIVWRSTVTDFKRHVFKNHPALWISSIPKIFFCFSELTNVDFPGFGIFTIKWWLKWSYVCEINVKPYQLKGQPAFVRGRQNQSLFDHKFFERSIQIMLS